jgi:hypothetical protein
VTDKPIRDAPDEAVAAAETRAHRLGLSQSEYARRGLAREPAISHFPVGTGELTWFAATFGDLADPDVMSRAWQRAVMRVRAKLYAFDDVLSMLSYS